MMFPRVIALQRTPQNKQFDYLSSVLQKGSNKFKLLDYSTSRPCRDSLLQVDYSFAIPGLLKTVDSSYYVNLNLERPFTGETIDTLKQRFTKKFDNTCTLHYCTRLAIPDGYKPGQVPRSLKYDAGDFGFESAYKVDEQGRFVVFTLATWVNTIDVPPSRFASWNEMVKQLNELYSHVITIEKAGATSSH
jgi:hypothetical protein